MSIFFITIGSENDKDNYSDLQSDANDSRIVPLFRNKTLSKVLYFIFCEFLFFKFDWGIRKLGFFFWFAIMKDEAMGLVLSAASVRGWTTGSGMEGPPTPIGAEDLSATERISTFPWSLFTKSPRRRMRVAFTCNVCRQRTTRAINPHAYTDGTVFVQVITFLFKVCIFIYIFVYMCVCLERRKIHGVLLYLQCCGCNVFHKLVDNLNLFHEMKSYVNPSFNYRGPNWDAVGFNDLDIDDEDGDDDVFPMWWLMMSLRHHVKMYIPLLVYFNFLYVPVNISLSICCLIWLTVISICCLIWVTVIIRSFGFFVSRTVELFQLL